MAATAEPGQDLKTQGREAQKNILSFASKDGTFRRIPSAFRSRIQKDGEFPPESGRYILYVSLACPWAHRTLIARQMKGLDKHIELSTVHPYMGALGWSFFPPIRSEDGGYPPTSGEVGYSDGIPGVIPDPIYGFKFLRELYFKSEPDYEGRFTVPVLWDKKTGKIVNNESSEILRMFSEDFNSILTAEEAAIDLYPAKLREEIDDFHSWVYPTINNGVYRCGFASKQEAYDEAITPLFDSLERVEKILEGKEFVIGGVLTEADVRLFTTIIRFDPVYVTHFKCNLKTIRDGFPNINRWMKNLYHNYSYFKDTTNFDHIKRHYFTSHPQVNPTRIIPKGFVPDIQPL